MMTSKINDFIEKLDLNNVNQIINIDIEVCSDVKAHTVNYKVNNIVNEMWFPPDNFDVIKDDHTDENNNLVKGAHPPITERLLSDELNKFEYWKPESTKLIRISLINDNAVLRLFGIRDYPRNKYHDVNCKIGEQIYTHLDLKYIKQEAELKAKQETAAILKEQQAAALLKVQQEAALLKVQQESALLKVQQEAALLKAKRDAEDKARQEAEDKARQELELKKKLEIEESIKIEAELKAKREAELIAAAAEKAIQDAAEKARQDAEIKARQEEAAALIAVQAKIEEQKQQAEISRRELELKTQQEAETNAKIAADKKAKIEYIIKQRQNRIEKANATAGVIADSVERVKQNVEADTIASEDTYYEIQTINNLIKTLNTIKYKGKETRDNDIDTIITPLLQKLFEVIDTNFEGHTYKPTSQVDESKYTSFVKDWPKNRELLNTKYADLKKKPSWGLDYIWTDPFKNNVDAFIEVLELFKSDYLSNVLVMVKRKTSGGKKHTRKISAHKMQRSRKIAQRQHKIRLNGAVNTKKKRSGAIRVSATRRRR